MAHTHHFNIRGYGSVVINVNGDWSGEATIFYRDEYADPGEDPEKKVEIPAQLLVELGKEVAKSYVRDKVVETLEDI